ncbi:MAG: ferritin [Opitutales bacterium]|nr:ferritin [Opitutales bacterium]
MKVSKALEKLLNEQIRNEYESAYIYLGMSVYLMSTPYTGFAQWMHLQAKEEIEHGNKILSHLGERAATVKLLPIAAPKIDYSSPLEVFKAALEHEELVTKWICNIYKQAVKDEDYTSQCFLKWFIDEQVEEEEQTRYFVERLSLAGKDSATLLFLDKEAGKRSE